MISFLKKIKSVSTNKGMTYIELIVVLSIFGIMSSVSIFKYADFEGQVTLQNLSQDIALQVIGAQKKALSGLLPNDGKAGSGFVLGNPDWRATYGIYFDIDNNKEFISFIDVDNNNIYTPVCPTLNDPNSECIDAIKITNGNFIKDICVFDSANNPVCGASKISISFTRPNSQAIIIDANGNPYSRISINVSNERSAVNRIINIYSSGRVEVN